MKLALLSLILVFVYACSHPLEIVGEGDILSASGNRDCLLEDFNTAQPNCAQNYVLGDYLETYFAVPRAGWEFSAWEVYCTAATDNECSFILGAATVQQYWFQTAPALRAVFIPAGGIPAADTISVAGSVWAQTDLFTGLSWNAINAVCPAPTGDCINGGTLNGYNMTGWSWASVDEVNDLFNAYIGGGAMGPGKDSYLEQNSAWAPAFYSAGWRATLTGGSSQQIIGWLNEADTILGSQAFLSDQLGGSADQASTFSANLKSSSNGNWGAWFYQTP